MAGPKALASCLLAAALFAGGPAPASAQCRLCSTPTTERSDASSGPPIRIQVQTALDFDRLVLTGAGTGHAALLPNGERDTAGTIATISARAMVGSVTVHGDPGRALRVELPEQINLYALNGARIVVDSVETDLPDTPKLDSAGNLSFRFGGRVTVTGDAEGEYRGDVPITVDYL